jgi:glyoxylase-like metal-dependent hydrolase (beta-lactamase superfamily II)
MSAPWLTLGDLRVWLINDGLRWVDAGGAFGLVPRALWAPYQPVKGDNLVPMHNHVLYVEADGRRILVDTGLGKVVDPKIARVGHLERANGSLFDALARIGVSPEQIDLVVDTHLHSDHCGGNMLFDPDGTPRPAFPNAQYVVQRREYEDAMRPNERTAATYLAVNYQPLMESGQLRLLDGQTALAAGVTAHVTPGHTPAHMSIELAGDGQHALFACDMASYAVHFERLGWMTAYDVEPLITLETKRHWQRWAIETGAVVIFPHDSVRPAGVLTLEAGKAKPTLQPVPVTFA